MPATVYYEADADQGLILGRQIAVHPEAVVLGSPRLANSISSLV